MKKFFKILGIIVAVLLIVLGSVLFWLFSSSGNAFLKDKITQIANEKAPIGLEFTHFKLGFGEYAFAITDKQQSQIALSGKYSLLTLNTDAQIVVAIKDLSVYEKLINMRLNGGVSIDGNVSKKGSNLAIKANINAFNSAVNADVLLENYAPKRLFIKSQEGLSVESLLHFLNQPKYATGRILLNADMDISNLKAPSGGFKVVSSAITPDTALLKKTFGLVLPKDSIALAINGVAKGESIVTMLLANASYLNITTNNLQASIKDFSSNGDIALKVQNIGFNDFMLQNPIHADLQLKSTKSADQVANVALNLFSNPIITHIAMPNYTPKKVQVSADDLSIKEILALGSKYADIADLNADGSVFISAIVDKINLQNMQYNISGNINSVIQSLRYQKMQLANNNTLKVALKGDAKAIALQAQSDLFDSKLNADANLKEYALDSVQLDLKGLNLQKLATILKYDIQGLMDAKVDLKNFKDSNFDGNFSVDSKALRFSKATLNQLSGMQFKNDLAFMLKGQGKFTNGSGDATLNLSGDALNVDFTNAKLNLKNNAYSTDFLIATKDIAKINPLAMVLKGALTLKGSAGFKDSKPSINLENKDFGDLQLSLKDEKFVLLGENLSLKKIAEFTDNGKLVKNGVLNASANLDFKLDSLMKNLTGNVALQSKNLEIYSIDIDGIARSYENANNINLLDVGAIVLAGPLGLAATKGANAGMLGVNSVVNTTSLIKELQANFDLKNGVANAKDLAFATGKVRLAAKGAINLNNNTFQNFTIALLDEKNCAKYEQTISGSLSSPKIQVTQTTIKTAVNLATSLLGRLKKGAEKVAKPIVGEQTQCTPFYNGVVKHPN